MSAKNVMRNVNIQLYVMQQCEGEGMGKGVRDQPSMR